MVTLELPSFQTCNRSKHHVVGVVVSFSGGKLTEKLTLANSGLEWLRFQKLLVGRKWDLYISTGLDSVSVSVTTSFVCVDACGWRGDASVDRQAGVEPALVGR